jgi:hypothetical protein
MKVPCAPWGDLSRNKAGSGGACHAGARQTAVIMVTPSGHET